MAKVRVPIANTPNKVAILDTDASHGAELGVNLFYQGILLRPQDILNQYAQGSTTNVYGSTGGSSGGQIPVDLTTSNVYESGNLYFTNVRAQAAVGGIFTHPQVITLTYNPATPEIYATLDNTAVTPGTYGDATHLAVFTVDAQGRLTNARQIPFVSGPPGEDGRDGEDGVPGPPGQQGSVGQQGSTGVPGIDGMDGQDGMDGIPGRQGLQGAQGQTGPPGDDGLEGPEGPMGPAGPPGPQGATGATGSGGMQKFTQAFGDGSTTGFTFTHNFGTRAVIAQIYSSGSPFDLVHADIAAATTNTVTANFSVAPTTNQYAITIIG